ncbi:MAG: cell division protein DivIVA [Candidatus Reconcilbacillus cellulovorans]|uniref:Cell division protein DivIVA n=1 Tax=Candidatus Reconcilbacillus cellulovorans TaxID=1906605 RepID=A0A2A6DWU5_9BACL|nr:MAG: cell division protein DivIVA [Candidatus Reconcilbacillus cellulovorans]
MEERMKYFTVEEANSLLPALDRDIRELQRIKREFAEKFARLRALRQANSAASADGDPFFELECELEFLQLEARTYIRSIGLKGAQLKDIDMGLVDFPARLNGRDVLLCWKQGEPRVMHYHGWDEGYAGRKPLEPPPGDGE